MSKAPKAPHLLIIDPSIAFPEDDGVAEILRGWPGSASVVRPALEPGSGPRGGDRIDADGVVLMGSRASVHDAQPWIAGLADWVREQLAGERTIPMLAICFGHQLVARAAGARVGYVHEDRSPVRAVVETAFRGGRLVPGEHTMAVVASHSEAVQDAPDGFDVTARRPESPIDALEHRTLPIFTVQFHPEARESFLSRRGIDPATVDPRALEDGRRVLGAFRRFVLSRHTLGA